MCIFQRTPAWIANVPTYKSPVAASQLWLMDNVPYYRNWLRLSAVFGVGDVYSAALDIDPDWKEPHSVNASNARLRNNLLAYMQSKIGHRPDLLEKCIPNYPPLSKRPPLRYRPLLWLTGGRVRWRTIQTVLDAGYVDAFRMLHPEDAGFTLPTPEPHIRLDYVFTPHAQAGRVISCDVVRTAAAAAASDHFPVVSDLKIDD